MYKTVDDENTQEMVSKFIYSPPGELSDSFDAPVEQVIQKIMSIPLDYFIYVIDKGDIEYCCPRHIPQYSNMKSAIEVEVNYLSKNGGRCSLEKIGATMPGQITDSVCAKVKYGENHSKLLEIFGIALVQDGYVQLTDIGTYFSQLDTAQRLTYVKRSLFRAPIIRNTLIKSKHQITSVMDELSLFLSDSTAKRRLSNVYNLIKLLDDSDQAELMKRQANIRRQ